MIDDSLDTSSPLVGGGFRLNLPPALVSIAISRSTVRRVVTFRDSDAESSFLVALTEIVANAIDEHVRVHQLEPIVLEVRYGSEDVVRVMDAGEGFDSTSSGSSDPSPDIDTNGRSEPDERGRGLLLARALVPAVEFEPSDGGTVVTLPLTGFGIVR